MGQDFGSCLAGALRRDDRPPTHFFVKKKFSSIGGAETATQKVPGVFYYARDFLCGVKRCATHGILQAGLPPVGGIPAMLPLTRGHGVPAPNRVCAKTPVWRRKYPARRRELFSLRKKHTAGIRLSVWQTFGSLYRLDPPLFSALQKPFKLIGIQGESLPDAPPAAHLRIRRSRIPRCVVKRRTTETRDSVSRPCPSPMPPIG